MAYTKQEIEEEEGEGEREQQGLLVSEKIFYDKYGNVILDNTAKKEIV